MKRKWTQKLFLLICLFSASIALSITTYGDFSENSTLIIACSIEGFEYPGTWSNDNINALVTCFKNGLCLPSTSNSQVTFSANISGIYVVINPLTSAVKTLWYCLHNGLSTSISFAILAPPSSVPTIFTTPSGSVISGETLTLTCEVIGGKPLASIYWECAGAFNERNTSTNTKAVASIQLTVFKTNDGKVCRCKAGHLLWTTNKTADVVLNVLYAPDTTPLIKQIPQGPIISGNKVTLACTVSGGKPLSNLSWDCNGTYTNNSSGNTASFIVELTVDNTYNTRVCTCVATHPVLSYRPAVRHELIVYYSPDTNLSVQQTPPGPIVTGTRVTLTCTVSGGNPLATLSWDCTGNTTSNTSGNTVSNSVDLVVDKTYDNKACTCSAVHFFLSYKPTIQNRLIVYYAPENNLIVEQLPIDVVPQMNVKLTCKVSGGNPLALLSWNCSGTTRNETAGNTASYSVEFTAYKADNNTICTCLANHIIASYKQTVHHRLIVFLEPNAPVAVFVVCCGASATVLWKSEFDGGLRQTFCINYWANHQTAAIRQSPNISDPGQNSDLQYTILYLESDTNYFFVVIAQNIAGNVKSKTVNCTTGQEHSYSTLMHTDQSESALFAVGISALVIGLIATIVAVVFLCRFKRKRAIHKRCEHYTEFSPKVKENTNTYDGLNKETELDAETVQTEEEKSTYEECKPPVTKENNSCQNVEMLGLSNKEHIKKDDLYENMNN